MSVQDTSPPSEWTAGTVLWRAGPILFTLAMLGMLRSVGHIPIYLGYVSTLAGLIWLGLTLQISKVLIPSYLLVFWGFVSLFATGSGVINYIQFTLVLGGIGLAELVSRMDTKRIADIVADKLLWIVVVLILIELAMIQAGLGTRARTIDASFIGSGTGARIPRFLGSMGGSAYSGTMLGMLGVLCWIEGRRRAAITCVLIMLLMISRGPMLALVMACGFQFFRRTIFSRVIAWVFVGLCVFMPLLVWYLRSVLSSLEILFLIEVSTRRFLHYITFLDFGLERPWFGIGYGNWREAYLDIFFSSEIQQWGQRLSVEHQVKEAHNFMLDIWGEMGILAWALAGTQMILTSVLAFRGEARLGAMFLFVVVCFLFLSGLSNWSYWMATGLVLSEHYRQRGPLHGAGP